MLALVAILLACTPSDPGEAPDATTRAEAACGEPVPVFSDKEVEPVIGLTRRPSPECEAVLREDFGIPDGSDVGLSAAWSLVLFPVPGAYDDAAFRIDAVVEGDAGDDAWASYQNGVVTIADPAAVTGPIGASILVHEAAHAWAPGHVRCPLTRDLACDDTEEGTVGVQVAWLDGLLGLADGRARLDVVDWFVGFRDGIEPRILDR